jgi:Mlc titration factor MtfA (ptsG expression regulator)
LIYPGSFFVPKREASFGGRVWTETVDHASGLASASDVVISWADAVEGAQDPSDRYNVVLHEFAHKLDMEHGGIADGVPELPDQPAYDDWAAVMAAAYEAHTRAVAQRSYTPINPYGATNAAEFFAEATVAFFEQPHRVGRQLPELYRVFSSYYGCDPSAWRLPV